MADDWSHLWRWIILIIDMKWNGSIFLARKEIQSRRLEVFFDRTVIKKMESCMVLRNLVIVAVIVVACDSN